MKTEDMKDAIGVLVKDSFTRHINEAVIAEQYDGEDDSGEDDSGEDDSGEDDGESDLSESFVVTAIKNSNRTVVPVKNFKALNKLAKLNQYDGFEVEDNGTTTTYAVSNGKIVQI
jgi:hypothetical protein